MFDHTSTSTTKPNLPLAEATQNQLPFFAFWAIGLLNNLSYMIMLAGAKEISEGGTALVFLADILPTLLVKVSSPYWFHRVSYKTRILTASFCFVLSFVIVACFSNVQGEKSVDFELFGVAFGSLGCGMGEATLLAFAGKVGGNAISAYSAGTGMSGVFGFLYFVTLNDLIGLSFAQVLWLGVILGFFYGIIFFKCLAKYENYDEMVLSCEKENEDDIVESTIRTVEMVPKDVNYHDISKSTENSIHTIRHKESVFNEDRDLSSLSTFEKTQLVLSLWRYMLPLFFVYAAEYAMQSGAWAAIGFPVGDKHARDQFYLYAGWAYQFGVLLSRSSGFFISSSVETLWILASLQIVMLACFIYDAIFHFWYNWGLLIPCFITGLFGGFIYVQSFNRISNDVPRLFKEFALSSASMADTFGIVVADFCALFIQSCLYEKNGLSGASIDCPL